MQLCEHDVESLQSWLIRQDSKPVHAKRLLRHFYANPIDVDWSACVVPKLIQPTIHEMSRAQTMVRKRHVSADGTIKLLIGLHDGLSVEAVLMPGYRADRAACCISSQVGCAMACDFCASTINGLSRNLSVAEIVEQFLHLKREAIGLGRRLTSLVFMGMGEPMHNLENVIGSIKRIADPDLGGLGWRQVTVSTVGIVPGIDALAEADLNVHLAVSLHAADDETRSRIVPINRKYPIAEVMSAARRFQDRTGRVPTIEWCMLGGVNDSDGQAEKLVELMRGFRAHVNLIPWNSIGRGVSGAIYHKPQPERMARFADILRRDNVVVHFRDMRGDDVSAACGQLAVTNKLVQIG